MPLLFSAPLLVYISRNAPHKGIKRLSRLVDCRPILSDSAGYPATGPLPPRESKFWLGNTNISFSIPPLSSPQAQRSPHAHPLRRLHLRYSAAYAQSVYFTFRIHTDLPHEAYRAISAAPLYLRSSIQIVEEKSAWFEKIENFFSGNDFLHFGGMRHAICGYSILMNPLQ